MFLCSVQTWTVLVIIGIRHSSLFITKFVYKLVLKVKIKMLSLITVNMQWIQ